MQSEVVGVAENWGVCCYPDAIQRCNKHLLKERILEFLEWFMWSMVLEGTQGTQGTHRLKNMVFFFGHFKLIHDKTQPENGPYPRFKPLYGGEM